MGTLFIYMLKAAGGLLFFYLFYKVLLSNETFHRFNRWALMGIALVAMVLPGIPLHVSSDTPAGQIMMDVENLIMAEVQTGIVADNWLNMHWALLLVSVYVAGIIVFWIAQLYSFACMYRLMSEGRKELLPNGVHLIIHQKEVGAFSWMNYIVMAEKDYQENGKVILTHEQGHIQAHHSCDLLLANCLLSLQWFNPAAWLWKRELQNIHEFEADEWVINQGINAKNYQLLLIRKAVGTRLYSMANSFNHSSLKKRITMMVRKKSNPWARAKYLYILPLATVAAVAFARTEVSSTMNEISSVKVNDLSGILKADESNNEGAALQAKVKVQGVVMDDATGLPLQGVSVIIRNTNRGALTNLDGNFSLEAATGDVLCFSFIGKEFKTVKVKNGMPAELEVRLKESTEQLGEFKVVAHNQEVETSKQKVDAEQGAAPKQSVPTYEGEAFVVVEEMPEFPGGTKALFEFLSKNVKYPAEAMKKKIEGRVITTFIVEKDGSLSNIEIKRSPSPILSAEAKRVIGMMPAWKPGKQRGKAVSVSYCVPISFKLPGKDDSEKATEATDHVVSLKVDQQTTAGDVMEIKNYLRKHVQKVNVSVANKEDEAVAEKPLQIRSTGKGEKDPLVLVDGKEYNDDLSKINPRNIERIEVIKDPAETQKYGSKAKYGVILVKLVTNKK